jgi:hypothetical protein
MSLALLSICGMASADPGQVSLSLEGIGAQAFGQIPMTATQGIGLSGTAEYRLSSLFALGLTSGIVEFIAPHNAQDMKTIWLDLSGRFFPLPASPAGEWYFQLGMGVSPHLGLFPDYWPNYTDQLQAEQFYQVPSGNIYWDAQAALGYLFSLGGYWALDVGAQYDFFWPPLDTPLQTIGLRSGIVLSFDVGKL